MRKPYKPVKESGKTSILIFLLFTAGIITVYILSALPGRLSGMAGEILQTVTLLVAFIVMRVMLIDRKEFANNKINEREEIRRERELEREEARRERELEREETRMEKEAERIKREKAEETRKLERLEDQKLRTQERLEERELRKQERLEDKLLREREISENAKQWDTLLEKMDTPGKHRRGRQRKSRQ